MAVSFATYERVALEDGDGQWELVCGKLREKQPMTQEHNRTARRLGQLLSRNLSILEFDIGESIHLRVSSGTYVIPDLAVLRLGTESHQSWTGHLEVYEGPILFVVEVWSPSTGQHDAETKVPFYKERGDAEIWQIDAGKRTVTSFVRAGNGTYSESTFSGGLVTVLSLSTTIDLALLFSVLDS